MQRKNKFLEKPPPPVNRHEGCCKVCQHEFRAEIEAKFLAWESPQKIAEEYGLADRASIYRHAHAVGFMEKRRRNVRAALEHFIEKSSSVEVTAPAVVAAIQAYAKINSQGQWIERKETVDMNELFERMSKEELLVYAERGTLPAWYAGGAGAATDDEEGERLIN
jgi:hypothetical protein